MAGLFKSINEFHPLSNNKIKSGAANKVGYCDVFETASSDNLQTKNMQLEYGPSCRARNLRAFECSVDERNLSSELEQFPFNRQAFLGTPHKIEV